MKLVEFPICSNQTCQGKWLAESKRLKEMLHLEKDVTKQGLLFLEGVTYFILTAQAVESKVQEQTLWRMYNDNLSILK